MPISSCEVKTERKPLRDQLSGVIAPILQEGFISDESHDAILATYDEYTSEVSLKEFITTLNELGLSSAEYNLDFVSKHAKPKVVKQLQNELYSSANMDLFRGATSAQLYVEQYFIDKAFQFTFVNRSKGIVPRRYVTSGEAFNAGIVDLKNALCKEIVSYKKYTQFPKKFFNGQGAVINENTGRSYYEELMELVEDDFIPNFNIQSNPDKNQEVFNVFSAIYILNNFDNILSEELEGIVKVNMDNRGNINNTEYAKELSRDSTIYWAGDDHESKGVDKFVSHLAKFIVSTMPKMTYAKDGKTLVRIPGQYCTTADMFMLAGILKQAEYEYNLIHKKDKDFKPLVISDNPKVAIRTLLEGCDEIPIMKNYGHDLSLSFRAFLYSGDSENYGIAKLYNDAVKSNFGILDIESLLTFEINKTVTPTYVEYDQNGNVAIRNYGKKYKASSRLDDNVIHLLFLHGYGQNASLKKLNIAKLKASTSASELLKDQNAKNLIETIFEMDDADSPKYAQFIEDYRHTIIDILSQAKDFKSSDPDDFVKTYIEASDYFLKRIKKYKNSQKSIDINSVWGDMKRDANKFMSTQPMTNFDGLDGGSIPVNRLSSALFQDNQLIYHYHEDDEDREYLNFLAANPNILSRYNWTVREAPAFESLNSDYETSTGFALSAGTESKNTSVDKMTPEDQLYVSFVGNWLDLRQKGIFATQPAPYSDKKSIGLKYINEQTRILIPWERLALKKIVSFSEFIADKGIDGVLKLDWFYRKNQKIKLANKLLRDWEQIAKEIGADFDFRSLTDEEIKEIISNESKISSVLLENINKLDAFIRKLKSIKDPSDPNYQRDLQDNLARIATRLKINLIDELHMSKSKEFGWGLNQTFLFDLMNLRTFSEFKTYENEVFEEFYDSKEVSVLKKLIRKGRQDKFKRFKLFEGKVYKGINEDELKKELRLYVALNDLMSNQYRDLCSKEEYLDPHKMKKFDISKALSAKARKSVNTIKWAKESDNGYELSTRGDSRFSAKKAKFAPGTIIFGHDVSGRTIESVYQNGVKQGDWKTLGDAKTGAPKSKAIIKGSTPDDSYKDGYLPLWQVWAEQNPDLIDDLEIKSEGKVLTDMFTSKQTTVSQARALAEILTEKKIKKLQEDKSFSLNDEELLQEYRKQEKSARINAMAKRMVLYPATIEQFMQKKIDGVSPSIKVSIVEDSDEETFNLKGSTSRQKIFDGAAYISVYYSLMENNSMPGRGIRGTKKPLGVAVSNESSALFKYAEFEINNQRIRNSKGNKFDMERVFKKMHDLQFRHVENGEFISDDIDLTKDYFGNSLEDIEGILGRKLYYSSGFGNYLVQNIHKVGFNTYEFTVRPVYENGHSVQVNGEDIESIKFIKRINSIYDLWKVLGGYEAKEIIDGKLEYSEINNEIIAQLIYRVGSTTAKLGDTLTQENVKQPLREFMVSMLATKGAVKRGTTNTVSSHSCWETDDELPYFDVSTSNFGIQLDANHHSDLAELTEMSQTISSLAALGYTREYANQAYEAIGRIIENSLTKSEQYLTDIERGNIEKVLRQLSERIVKALATEKNITTANSFVRALAQEMKDGLILPVSDKRFYKIFAKDIISDLNKSSIKRKYTGLGGILNPSSNIYQLYESEGKAYTFEDLLRQAKLTLNTKQFAPIKQALIEYWKTNKTDQARDIVAAYIMRNVNPQELPLALQQYERLQQIKDDELRDDSGNLRYDKKHPEYNELVDIENLKRKQHFIETWTNWNPNYGFEETSMSEINVLDTVGYYEIQEDGSQLFRVKFLTNIEDYLEFKYEQTGPVFICKLIPHDLRPQIEHWKSQSSDGIEISRDTWSEPYVYLAMATESYDPKNRDSFVNSRAYKMLEGLVKYQADIEGRPESVNIILEGFLAKDRRAKKAVTEIITGLRMCQAELHSKGLDYDNLIEIQDETGNTLAYDWNKCLKGINLLKGITEQEIPVESLDFAKLVDYNVDAAEVILPKIYRSNFHLGNRSINEINEQFFLKAETYYKSSLKTKNGRSVVPIDFLIRTHTGNFNIVIGDLDSDQFGENVKLSEGDWQLDSAGNRLFKINKNEMSLFQDKNGIQTLVIQKNANFEDNLELVIDSVTNIVSVQPFLENIVGTELENPNVVDNLIQLSIDNTHIKTYNNLLDKAKDLTGADLALELNKIYIKSENNYRHDLANTLYNSFVKTLDIISTRIPTQALQSFMAMKVKALTNDESNNVFVSRWQLWLQGSDLDIDKSYMMGVNISNIGIYDHWSPLADYTTRDLAKVSDELPIPNKKQVTLKENHWRIKSGDIIDVEFTSNPTALTELVDDFENIWTTDRDADHSLLKAKYKLISDIKVREAIMLKIESEILKLLDQSSDFKLLESQRNYKSLKKLFRDLNNHNKHIVTPEAARNIVAKSMRQVSTDGRNMMSAYSPIDDVMSLFTDELKKHDFEARLQNLDNPLSTFRIQYENAVGKQDVGIMANGLKVFFCATQYFNNYWSHVKPELKARFLKKLDLGINGSENIRYNISISDIQIEQAMIQSLNKSLELVLGEEEYAKIKTIAENRGDKSLINNPHDDASLLISSLVSLATDNAKELALAKLNAGINLACMHVYLTVMGYSAEDIVNYTTSQLFKDFTAIIAPSQFDESKKGRIDKKTWAALKRKANSSNAYTAKDVDNLRRLYDSAQEMTSIAKILGINQGVKVDEFEASEYIDEFQEILSEQIKRITDSTKLTFSDIFRRGQILATDTVLNNLLIHQNLPITPALKQELADRIDEANRKCQSIGIDPSEPINMHKYFTDDAYRDAIVSVYDVFKETFNVYDIINNSKHFYSMLKAFDSYINVLMEGSARAKWALRDAKKLYDRYIVSNNEEPVEDSDNETRTVFDVPYNYNEACAKAASRMFDDYVLSEFLSSTSDYDFEVKVNSDQAKGRFKINYGKSIDPTKPVKNKDINIQQFIKFVNVVLIPKLKEEYPNNYFVKALRPDTSGLKALSKGESTAKAKMKWVFNFDIDKLNSPASRNLYFDVVSGFDEIASTVTLEDLFGDDVISGQDLKLGDILYLYDQILNFSSFGQGSLEKVFDHYIESNPELPLRIAEIETEHDKGIRQMNVSKEQLMAFILRSASKFSAANGIIEFKSGTSKIDTNVALLSLQEVKSIANDYYRDTELLLDAISKNLISVKPVC